MKRLAAFDLDGTLALSKQPLDDEMADLLAGLLDVAMGQAPEEVRAAARHVSTSNDEDGVAHAIDDYLLPMIGGTA